MLILIFAGAHFLEEYVENKSRKEITALLAMAPQEARRYTDTGALEVVPVTALNIGDQLQILNGAQVPTDGVIIAGTASLNEAAISGESIPREKQTGDEVFGGTINGKSTFDMRVTKSSDETVFAKIVQMVQSAQDSPTKTASVIQRFEPIYVKAVLAVLPIVLLCGTIFTSLVMGNQHLSHDRLLSGCVAVCLGRQRGAGHIVRHFKSGAARGSF